MKELSIEEKAKSFKEALSRAKGFYKRFPEYKEILEKIFPQLKGSEDEKIRGSLLEYLHTLPNHYAHSGVCALEWIAWLEAQGGQNPIIEMKTSEESLGIDSDTYNKIVDECVYGEQKPAWSEEDEREVAVLEAYIRGKDWSERHIDRALGIVDELVNKAKSLRPQSTWKPSDGQMVVLNDIICNVRLSETYKGVLKDLYEQLSKLKEK